MYRPPRAFRNVHVENSTEDDQDDPGKFAPAEFEDVASRATELLRDLGPLAAPLPEQLHLQS